MKVIILIITIVILYVIVTNYSEPFVNPINHVNVNHIDSNEVNVYANNHGSAPAGVNALSGEIQYEQNANAPHVNKNKGNPQNEHSYQNELKIQPRE